MPLSEIATGTRFGRWTVLGPSAMPKDRKATFSCRCDCGNTRDVIGRTLTSGHSSSCGCAKTIAPGMRSRIDLTDQQFGAWTVLSYAGLNEIRQSTWLCRCDCGTERIVASQPLRTGKSRSCGCLKSESIARAHITHGRSGSRAYQVWRDMVRRCTDPNAGNWLDYGGRGITICDEWLKFENWNADMGDPPPGMTFERINNDGNYYKANCKWATIAEQNANKRGGRDSESGRFFGRDRMLWAPEYRAWNSMIARCQPGNRHMRSLYYDRGITVCDRWQSFENFLADMGPIPHPGWTLDRIDNDKIYELGNCRWADCKTQAQNRRQNQKENHWRRKRST